MNPQLTFYQNLDFGLFILFALLIAILYSLSAIEVLFVKDRHSQQEMENVRRSAQWGVLGVLFTLGAGAYAQVTSTANVWDVAVLSIPLFFTGRWAIWYIKYSRVSEDLILLKKDIDFKFREIIKESLRDISNDQFDKRIGVFKNEEGFTNRISILMLCQSKLRLQNVINAISIKAKTYSFMSEFTNFYNLLVFDIEKLDSYLRDMQGKKQVEMKIDGSSEVLYRLSQEKRIYYESRELSVTPE